MVKYSLYLYVLATDDVVETSGESRNEEKRNIPYPKQIFCIISMEACERFSFYGMNSKGSLKKRVTNGGWVEKVFLGLKC